MTPNNIRLLKESFAAVEPIADDAAAMFYRRLFTVAPSVEPLFKGDIVAQGRMLMSTIGLVVKSLERPETILPSVRNLGARHAGYGALPEHYPVVGETLLWTLEQGLGEKFTPAHREAWSEAYALLSSVMIEAQRSVATTKVA